MSICKDCDRQYQCPKTVPNVIKCKFYFPKNLTTIMTQGGVSKYQTTITDIEHTLLHGYYDLMEEDFEPVVYNPKFLKEMEEIKEEKPIRVNNIDKFLVDEKLEEILKDVDYLKSEWKYIIGRLEDIYKEHSSLELKVNAIDADNEYLEKKIMSKYPPITKVDSSVSTVSEKDNDLVEFIREQIRQCDRISPIKDMETLRLLKKSILEQLLLDYSAKECKHVDEL